MENQQMSGDFLQFVVVPSLTPKSTPKVIIPHNPRPFQKKFQLSELQL